MCALVGGKKMQEQAHQFHLLERVIRANAILFAEHNGRVACCKNAWEGGGGGLGAGG